MQPAGDDPRHHPWWAHVPPDNRPALLSQSRRRRLIVQLNRRPCRIAGMIGLYSLTAAITLWLGAASITWVTLLPLVLLPGLAGLAWWLTWRDYHH